MNVTLDNIPVGTWRNLTKAELQEINEAVAHSAKTEDASLLPDDEE
jgi:23S rRNA pseudouridine2604 synthase